MVGDIYSPYGWDMGGYMGLLNQTDKQWEPHNIIQSHNNVLWDWKYYVEYSS